jgi:hypothetical protein
MILSGSVPSLQDELAHPKMERMVGCRAFNVPRRHEGATAVSQSSASQHSWSGCPVFMRVTLWRRCLHVGCVFCIVRNQLQLGTRPVRCGIVGRTAMASDSKWFSSIPTGIWCY